MSVPTASYLESVDDVVASFETTSTGLTTAQADEHRARFGSNVIVEVTHESGLRRYLRQYKDWMIVLLLASAVVTGILGDFGTAGVLVVLVVLNTLIGFVQEYRAEKTMEALERLVDPLSEVYRDGELTQVASTLLVVGDVVRLTEGSSVPADVRLIRSTAFSTNDFALTGESDPTRKFVQAIPHEVPVADRHNMAFAGTTVATGEAFAVVIATGMGTELGRIARLSQSAPVTRSPLQLETTKIARYVTYGVAVVTAIVLVIAVQSDLAIKDALLFAVGFACALIPQGLPAEVNTALAAAAGILAKQNALVKRLSAVETLGATHVICTDKTGTLTKNQMTVTELTVGGATYTSTGTGYDPAGTIAPTARGDAAARLTAFLSVGVLASNARLVPPATDEPAWRILGDPTEGALVVLARKGGIDPEAVAAANEEIGELPFDSTRKLMTSIRRGADGTITAYAKGAPESILERATRIVDGTRVRPITAADREALLAVHTERATRALRNLLFATRTLTAKDAATNDLHVIEKDLTVLGMVSMIDPIRTAVPAAMADVLAAGVKVNIVTGDFSLTAEAIARQAGLIGDDGITVVTGAELAGMSDEVVLEHASRGGTVFSRVAPEDKVRIVDLVKAAGLVVAVTGDGINDAPALRHASIGVAMGATGTDVAKQAAEIVLLDDSFATLVTAIRQGRTIYRNISKGVLSCLTSNAAEFVANSASLALASLGGVPLALNVLQILAIDLLGEIFPIAALGRDRAEGETMKDPPRDPLRRILNKRSILDIFWAGALMGGFAIVNYLLFYGRAGIDPFTEAVPADVLAPATTMTYVTIMVCQLVSIVQRRSVHGFFTRYQFTNRTFWLAIGVAVAIMLVIVYVPFVAGFFGTGAISLLDWGFVLLAAVVFLALRELQRVLGLSRV
ncbi:MAG TPA: cation-transporting P-type ATPase [Rhodoglobus sp.]|nr:cation-transporting P-type ATPase [Rhodoglobus sp.]